MSESVSSNTRPLWMDTAVIPKSSHQTGQVSVDVCVIGAGITGLTAAELLKRAGKTVAVIDLSRIGWGETGHTTAHLTEVLDIDYNDLISKFGVEGGQLVTQSVRRSIERIEENAARYNINCDFKRVPGFQFTEKRSEIDALEDEAQAGIRIGVPNELVTEVPLPFKTVQAIRFNHQAQFHPIKYLAGLSARIPGNGSYIFEETRMLDVEEGEPCRVVTDRGTILAKDVFVAANVPSTNKLFLQTKIASYRTYAIAARVEDAYDQNALFWDIDDPYHYIRSYSDGSTNYVIIGGADHKTGQDSHTLSHFADLEDWAHERFRIGAVTHRWSGQIVEPVDGLPYIGKNPLSQHIYVATGYSGTGLTFGTVGGMLVSDLILGNDNPWEDLYDPSRVKPLASMKTFLAENIDYPSHLIGDRLTPAQASNEKVLRENEGAIVRVGGKKVAAYRDPQGEMHLMSPVCPHLGCYVNWNDAEKSWDCPCHGARFSATGKLMNGPAVTDLASEEFDENVAMIPERYEQERDPANPNVSPLLTFSCPCKAPTI